MTCTDDKLSSYRSKRDFERTREPEDDGGSRGEAGRRYVIQRHETSSTHFDLRVEVDGVLKSWAVPKGPSTDPGEQRLAIRTEDHPLDYADFEGVIPEDEYGGGTVMVWDRGTYRNLRARKGPDSLNMEGSLRGGQIEVWLEGKKLRGGYVLKRIEGGEKARWLLIKMDDEWADARRNPTSTENESVKTGRSMHEIESDADSTPDDGSDS
jgi:DNA ligase D-like protein (predicted 3'-phosphoesterase)